MRRSAVIPCLTRLLLVVILAAVQNAWGHAVLLETVPADGAILVSPPDKLLLRFNEPVMPVRIALLDGSGASVPLTGAVSATGTDVRLPLSGRLAEGQYLVSYRVTSIDSHPVAGSFIFNIGDPAATPVDRIDIDSSTPWLSEWLAYLNRTLHYLTLLSAAGLAFFQLLFALPERSRQTLSIMLCFSAALGIVSAVLSVGLGGRILAGDPASHLLTMSSWTIGAQTSLAISAGVAVPGFIALISSTRLREARLSTSLLATGAVLIVASLGFSGHAAQAPPGWLMTPALILHALMAAIWFGSLWALHLVVYHESAALSARLLAQFSRRAAALVILLLLSAAVLAWFQIGRFTALFSTQYGFLLLLKLTLVFVLLGIAGLNRWWLVPQLAQGRAVNLRYLQISIRLELLLVIAIIAVTAALGSTPPSRALQKSDRSAQTGSENMENIIVHADGIDLSLEVVPAKLGTNKVTLRFAKADQRIEPQEVTFVWSLPSAGIEPLQRTARLLGNSDYELADVTFVIPGLWQLKVDALIDDFTKIIFRSELPLLAD